jgi:hypothetical protein
MGERVSGGAHAMVGALSIARTRDGNYAADLAVSTLTRDTVEPCGLEYHEYHTESNLCVYYVQTYSHV